MKGHSCSPDGCPKCGKIHRPPPVNHLKGDLNPSKRLEIRAKIGAANSNPSEETRRKKRESQLGKKKSLGAIEKSASKQRGVPKNFTPEVLERYRVRMKGERNPAKRPEIRKKIRQTHLEKRIGENLWQNPEYIAKQRAARKVKQNKAEKKLQDLLDKFFPGQWRFVGDFRFRIGRKFPDFIHVDKKLIIELFGGRGYIHFEYEVNEKKEYFSQFGYQTLVIWEEELKEPEVITKRVQEFLQ